MYAGRNRIKGKGIPNIIRILAPGRCITLKSIPTKHIEKEIKVAVYKNFKDLSSVDFNSPIHAIGKNMRVREPNPANIRTPAPAKCEIFNTIARSVMVRQIMPDIYIFFFMINYF